MKRSIATVLVMLGAAARAWGGTQGPDLTTNMTPGDCAFDFSYSYHLGPTGLRGWIYLQAGEYGSTFGPQGLMTAAQPWQILVTAVGTNTPAAGVFATNDVILGVSTGSNNVPVQVFTNDARKSLGWAIGDAEAGDGWMNLKRWRAGVTSDVAIRLPLRGLAYSATAPYNCPKSALILSNAVNIIANQSFNKFTPGNQVLGLAMLASGNTNLLPKVQAYARAITLSTVDAVGWELGFKGVFLAEYYLKTGDTNVLPVLSAMALNLAQATDRYGTMCHNPSLLNDDGSYNGTSCGYGPVNNVALTVNLAMVLCRKSLVAAGLPVDPAIDVAISRGANFFGWHVQKGGIQYGEMNPWGIGFHASNGKHGQAALLFSLLGDQPAATEYWARMTLAGYNGREYGHSGQGLSYLWEGMGANVGGTNAMAAYMANIRWHLDLERRCDGAFMYDGHEQCGPSQVNDYWANYITYNLLDPTATYVLTYAVAQQQICLTGRNANPSNTLGNAQITNALDAGRFPQVYTNYTTNQLIAALTDYDPDVRYLAALQLGACPGVTVASMIGMACSTNPWLRASACTVLGVLADTNGLTALGQCLTDPDLSVRAHATLALGNFGEAASPLLPTMLSAFITNATDPRVIDWNDPYQEAETLLSSVIFGDAILYAPSVGGNTTAAAAKDLLYPAVRIGLKLPDSVPRLNTAAFLKNYATLEDLQALLPDVIQCATTPVLADPMWSSGGRSCSIGTMAKYQVAETIPVALRMLNPPWVSLGQGDNPEQESPAAALGALAEFGDFDRWTLPTLNNYVSVWGTGSSLFTPLGNTIASIRSATSAPVITNLFPVANSQVVMTTNAVAITLTGSSCRTNAVTFLNLTAPNHGLLTGTAPNLTYTPYSGFSGVDHFLFQVADGMTYSDPATVSILVGVAAGTGLKGQYYDNMDFTSLNFTRIDPQVNFDWGAGSPSNSMAASTYSVRWSGLLLAPESGNYMFSTLNSDGVRLYVNGILVIDDWLDQVRQWTDGAVVPLVEGQKYAIQMDYFESDGDAVAKLKWTGPSFAGSNGVIIGSGWLYDASGVTNLPLYAFGQSVTLVQNTNQVIILAGSAGATSYPIVSGPSHGILSGTPPLVTYTPATNYAGGDSFTFKATDGVTTSAAATVTISVLAGSPLAYYWNTPVNGAWSVAGNWTNSTGALHAPAATGQSFYSLNFNVAGTYSASNDLNSYFALNQLNLAANATVAGNALSLTNNGPGLPQINQNGANNITINVPLDLAALTTLGGTGSGGVTLNGFISGNGGLVKNTFGNTWINGWTNTYAGGTVLNVGYMSCPTGDGSPTTLFGTGPITLNAGASLDLNRTSLSNSIALNGGRVTGGNSWQSYFRGPVTLTGVSTIDQSTTGGFTISGNVSGPGGLKTIGTTSWTMSGTNTYTGPTIIAAGAIQFNNSLAVATNLLSISDGAVANLNYPGTATIRWLTLGGVDQPAGTYGSSSSAAANKDGHFAGLGTVTLVPLTGGISNQPASIITSNSATLNARLTGNGVPYNVLAYWNTTNAGNNAALWTNALSAGSFTAPGDTNISCAVTGLRSATKYYFAFRATNTIQNLWDTNVLSFVTSSAASNAYLGSLVLSSGTLTPLFDVFKYSYTASVLYAASNLIITPTAVEAAAVIRINGSTVASGSPSAPISLSIGTNSITNIVVAGDSFTTNTYLLKVIRAPASVNASLAGLAPSIGTLSPAFVSNTYSYTDSVWYATASLTVTPTAVDPVAKIKVNGSTVASGYPSSAINLNIGTNTITNMVVSESQTATNTYLLKVIRAPASTNASLANLVPSVGTLSPAFAGSTFSYTDTVTFATASLSVTPTAADANATTMVNTNPVISGNASGSIPLNMGTNFINTVVISESRSKTNIYVLAVIRTPLARRWWDGGSAHIAGNGNGASAGGGGTWDASTTNWDQGSGQAHVKWNNTNGDIAVFGGSGGTVTNMGATAVGGMIFTNAYTVVDNTLRFVVSGSISNSDAVTLASQLDGNAGVAITKEGGGTLTLTCSANTYNGGTLITAGSVRLATGDGNISGFLGAGPVSLAGATLSLDRNILTNDMILNGGTIGGGNGFPSSLCGSITLAATSTITYDSGSFSISGTMTGPGGLNYTGGMTLDLRGANTFRGPLAVNNDSTLSVASLNSVSGGTSASNLGAPTNAANGVIALGSGTTSGTLTYTGPGETSDRILQLAGTTGGLTILQRGTASGIPVTQAGRSGLLQFTSNLSVPGTAGVDNRKILTLSSSGSAGSAGQGEISGSLGDSVLGNAGQRATSLIKAGDGLWTLSGSNSYSGATRVQAGVLGCARATALGTNSLDITGGAKVALDFVGTRKIGVLSFDGGAAQPNGTYGSSSSIAATKDDTHFSGPGAVLVGTLSSPTSNMLVLTGGTNPCSGGGSLTFTATVTGGHTPGGSVIFYDGLAVLGSNTLNGSFQASFTINTLSGGVHNLTALYPGNASNGPSASATLVQTVVEARPVTTVSLARTAGANPSRAGEAITFTATVTGSTPTGIVIFYSCATAIGSAALNGFAQASFTTASLPGGWQGITARYLGDANNAPCETVVPLWQTVQPSAGNGKLKVFILAGQSNMQGKGEVENGGDPSNPGTGVNVPGGLGSLRYMLNRDTNKYGYLIDTNRLTNTTVPGWRTLTNVWVSYFTTADGNPPPNTRAARKGYLDADFGNGAGQGEIGPEYGFGLVMGSQLADPVLIIKTAWGGTSLDVDWRPPSSGGTIGPCYTTMVAIVQQVLTNLTHEFTNFNYSGGGYEIAGFGWHQGWNDIGEPESLYETNLVNLIHDVRVAFGVPNLPVAIGTTGMGGASSDQLLICAAQAAAANPVMHPELAGTVFTVDTRPFDYGVLLGPTPSQEFHWYHNAQSYFNVGQSMGLGMLSLLTSRPGVTNQCPSGVSSNSARLAAGVNWPSTPCNVRAYWGPVNGGTNAAVWTNSAPAATWTSSALTYPYGSPGDYVLSGGVLNSVVASNVSLSIAGLITNKTYYFTFCATNGVQSIWATNVMSFVTSAIVDNDHDGLPDDWEIVNFGSLAISNGLGDQDGDGFSDFAEFLAGTSPTNSSSRLYMKSASLVSGSQVVLTWASEPGKKYQLLSCTNLLQPNWHTNLTGISGQSATISVTNSATGPDGFFKIVLE